MDWERTARVLAAAIGAVGKVVRRYRGADADADALTVIGALVDSVGRGELEGLELEAAEAELQRLVDALEDRAASPTTHFVRDERD